MIRCLILVGVSAWSFGAVSADAASPPVATRLDASNIEALQPGGPDAIAGLDDWVLSNGTLCAAISDVRHESGFVPWGGVLVDLHHCGVADDQWAFQHVLPNLNKDKPLEPKRVETENWKTGAAVVVTSEGDGLELTSRYQLDEARPRQLSIEHELRRTGDGEPVRMFGTLMLHPGRSLTPYSLSMIDREYARGFSHPVVDRDDWSSMIESMIPADVHILVGDSILGEISYGVQALSAELIDESGAVQALPRFQQTDPTYSTQATLSRQPWLGGHGKLGLFEFAQSLLMDVRRGETLRFGQRIYLGDRADVASVTDQIYEGGVLEGSVDTPDAIVHVRDPQGFPLTAVKPDGDRQFRVRLPKKTESAVIVVSTPWGNREPRAIEVQSDTTSVGLLHGGGEAFVELPSLAPVRLIFDGIGSTTDPDFNDNLLDFRVNGEVARERQAANYLSLAGTRGDPQIVPLRPGKYRVLATRGMEFGVTETEVSLSPGETLALQIDAPAREVPEMDWLTADFHVHSAPSFDSYIPVEERLREFVAFGSDVLVASEHNRVVDYQNDIERIGLEGRLHVIAGTELTGMSRTPSMPFTHGHASAFPLVVRSREFAGGVPAHERRRLRNLLEGLSLGPGPVLLQLNHPRTSDTLGADQGFSYFDHLVSGGAYDPELPLTSEVNRSLIERDPLSKRRDLDFDLMEIANGADYEAYQAIRRDWMSLLAQGERIVGSANSDSHGSQQPGAIPQNYVVMAEPYNESGFIQAVREGRLLGTTGPLLDVYARTPAQGRVEMGETVSGGQLSLHVHVRAASWVPVQQLTVYVNGEARHRIGVSRDEEVEIPLSLPLDSFLIVEVTGEADALYSAVAPGFTPFAFSNPIYVDADADGEWQAPRSGGPGPS